VLESYNHTAASRGIHHCPER